VTEVEAISPIINTLFLVPTLITVAVVLLVNAFKEGAA